MKMMILGLIFIISSVEISYSQDLTPECAAYEQAGLALETDNTRLSALSRACEISKSRRERETTRSNETQRRRQEQAATEAADTASADPAQCKEFVNKVALEASTIQADTGYKRDTSPRFKECLSLSAISQINNEKPDVEVWGRRGGDQKASPDGKITCVMLASFTADYDECVKAISLYTGVVAADQALDLTQVVRTDNKNRQISAEAGAQAAKGDSQGAMFDSAIESNKHMKSMQQEKVTAYTSAVAALSYAHKMFPDEADAVQDCKTGKGQFKLNPYKNYGTLVEDSTCQTAVKNHKRLIFANTQAKGQLFQLITEYVSKGLRAGLQMKQYNTKAQAIAAAKKPLTDEPGSDMMLELCQANPQDPACIQRGTRVSGGSAYEAGDFSIGNGANNSFAMNPESSEFGEKGDPSTKVEDKNTVAGVNSPFADQAKAARDIVNPAAAAQFTGAGGGAGGGGAGGGGASLGGSASLGGDLTGTDKEGDKEASIKTGKVSGSYNNPSGGGFKGVSKSKDDANPFASLFDQKSDGGGVEEDRSIASGDIDGKASGLFEKISKRYSKIQADKRVEAKNLE